MMNQQSPHNPYEGIWVKAPSNIAFLKYWGKSDETRQWPANSSLSMTLSQAVTWSQANVVAADQDQFEVLAGPQPKNFHKAEQHLRYLRQILAEEPASVATPALTVRTQNSFPADCGIASSASGLGALTLAALSTWLSAPSFAALAARGFDRPRLAQLARQGSGSAGRSLFGGFVEWQRGESAQEQAILPCAESKDWPLADVIVLVDQSAKSISSTAAHRHAWTSPLFAPRLAGLEQRLAAMRSAIAARDLPRLGELIETEALDMHAVAMTSEPSCQFWHEDTPAMLAFVRRERQAGHLPAYFTLDAGPNLHLICAPEDAEAVAQRIQNAFPQVGILRDQIGQGPEFTRTPPPEFAMTGGRLQQSTVNHPQHSSPEETPLER